jgi:hypothetical protein
VQNVLDVAAIDDVFVDQTGTDQFMIHEYKDTVGTNSVCFLSWLGKTTLAPSSSTVYLQIYNRNTSEWETVDSDNSSSADVSFQLQANILDLTNYKDIDTFISCRIYQEAL